MPKKSDITIDASPALRRVNELLRIKRDAELRAVELDTVANRHNQAVIDGVSDETLALQAEVQQADAEMEKLAAEYEEWFGDKQSIKLPNGTVGYKESDELEIADADLTFILLEREEKNRADKTKGETVAAADTFVAEDYIRHKRELNKDALGTLDNVTLARLQIKRVHKDNFYAKPAKLDLGKAVKEDPEAKVAA